jgi:hypothetical protein
MPEEHTTTAGIDTPRLEEDLFNWSPANDVHHAVATGTELGGASPAGGEAAGEALSIDLTAQELVDTNGRVLISDDRITKLEADRDHWRERAVVWHERAVAAELVVKMLQRNLDDLRANLDDLRASTRPALGSNRATSALEPAWRRWWQDLSSRYFPREEASHRVAPDVEPADDVR